MRDIRQTPEYAKYLSQTGWRMERVDNTFVYIKNIPLLGSIIKIQRPEHLDFGEINQVARKYKTRKVIVEPTTEHQVAQLLSNNYKLSKSPFLPTKTLIIDLKKSEESIFENLKSDAKSAIKRSSDIRFIETTPEQFYDNWKKHTKSRFLLYSKTQLELLKKSFGNNCLFLVTENFSAGAMFLKAYDTVYYWKAFTSAKGRDEKAQYGLVWEGILWGKKKNAKIFDFEGIYDDRFPLKTWKWFSHFKKSFGGEVVEFPGAFVKTKLF